MLLSRSALHFSHDFQGLKYSELFIITFHQLVPHAAPFSQAHHSPSMCYQGRTEWLAWLSTLSCMILMINQMAMCNIKAVDFGDLPTDKWIQGANELFSRAAGGCFH